MAHPANASTDSDVSSSKIVLSHWTVKMPFEGDTENPRRIARMLNPIWSGLQPGQEIISANGIEIHHLNALRAVLTLSTDLQDQTQLPIHLGTSRDANGDLVEELIVMPIVQDTVLKNGMQFETEFV